MKRKDKAPRGTGHDDNPAIRGALDALLIFGSFLLGQLVSYILDVTGIWPIR